MSEHCEISKDNNARIAALEIQCSALPEMRRQMEEMQRQVQDLHRKFVEPTPTGEPPLVERMSKAVVAFERASWVGKTGVWLILGLGSLGAAGTAIITFYQRVRG